jgi:hypothetical protein
MKCSKYLGLSANRVPPTLMANHHLRSQFLGGYTMFKQTQMLEISCTLTFLKILGVKRCSIEVLRFMHALLCSLRI